MLVAAVRERTGRWQFCVVYVAHGWQVLLALPVLGGRFRVEGPEDGVQHRVPRELRRRAGT